MIYPQYLTLCGIGGQGIVLSALLIGTTAVTLGNQYAVQTQSYGSEARGGQVMSELILDVKPINAISAQQKTLLVAMYQESYDIHIGSLAKDGILVVDEDLVTEFSCDIKNTFKVPATQLAIDLGNRMAANMALLGFMSEALGIVKREQLEEVVKEEVSPRFVELNLKAIAAGVEYAKKTNQYLKD